jgi:hypothetical protein
MILFPLLMGIAMQLAPASHGAVVRAALPLLTGIGGTLIAGERPSLGFWVYSRLATGGSGVCSGPTLLAWAAVSAAAAYALGVR